MKKSIFSLGVAGALALAACSNNTQQTDANDAVVVENAETADNGMDDDVSEFFRDAAAGGMFEVQAAQIAQDKATSPQVKEFAATMIRDHDQANQKLMALARQMNVTLPQDLPNDKQNMLAELRETTDNFDEKYMDMMEKSHKASVDVFEDVIGETQNGELRNFAEQTLTVIRGHHDMASQIEDRVDG